MLILLKIILCSAGDFKSKKDNRKNAGYSEFFFCLRLVMKNNFTTLIKKKKTTLSGMKILMLEGKRSIFWNISRIVLV